MENRKQNRTRCPVENDVREGEEFRMFDKNRSVSKFGRVHDTRGNKIYTPKPTEGGDYARIVVEGTHWSFHRLVAKVWIDVVGPCPGKKYTIDHVDRNKSNNSADNLRWATMSQQRMNQSRGPALSRSPVQQLDQIAVEVRAPLGEWICYPSLMGAARALKSSVGPSITHGQLALILRSHPEGHTAVKGALRGWSFRKAGQTTAVSRTIKKTRTGASTKRKAEARAPGSDTWVRYESCLEASKDIKKVYGVTISSGSISRIIIAHPGGHVMTAKQNVGWGFRAAM